jgi:tetratricopeptide (TPR) repeat protein
MEARELTQIGPYTVRRFIAEGGMAWVFEVVDPRFEGRDVVRALKMLKPAAALGDEFQRFTSEASLLAGIDHPNLVTIFDFGKDEATDCFYYTMTFVDGPTMAEHLAEQGPFTVKEAGRIFTSVLDGLAELHDRGIIHRDIKPGNVLLGADGRARLADLGIARVEQERSLTRTGMAVGTVIYMSPNQARGQPVDASSDVFSVGLTLYEALTGRIVYENVEDLDSTSSHDVLGYLVSLGRTGDELEISYPPEASIPRAVTEVIEKACRFHPEDRYPNARAMRDALEAALRPAAPAAAAPRWPWLAAAAATALAAAAAGLYWGVWVPMQTQTRVEAKLGAAVQLQEAAPRLLERAKDLDPPPTREVLESTERTLERAQNYLVDGHEDFEVESYDAAEISLDRAIRSFGAVCDQLTGEHLTAHADASVTGVGQRVAELREAGAPEHLPEAWAGLEAQVASLAPPGAGTPPCTAAAAQLDRVDGAGAAMTAAAAVESDLGEVWPRLAAAARNDALKAQKLAEAEPVDAREYQQARSQGQTGLAEGRRRDQAEEHLAARDEYRKAAGHFRTAAAVVPAAKARAEVRRVEQEVAKGGSIDLGRASLLVAEADARYQQGDWEEAAGTYQQAVVAMRSRMAEADLEREARRARTDALAVREAAAREGGEFSAPGPLARGDQARTEAEEALEGKRYAEAERGFQAAQSSYAEARNAAIEALAAARGVETQLRQEREKLLGGRDCAGFESSTALGECETALAELNKGAEAMTRGDAPSALRSYRAALAALDRTAGAELKFEETKQWPPELVSRSPRRETVEVYRNKTVKLAVRGA